METEEIGEIGELPDNVEDIHKDPILKPLLDYSKMALMLEKEDASESQYLEERMKELKTLLDTGIYETSMVAIKYNNVLEIYKRLLFIMARYTGQADKKMGEIKKIVHKYYMTKKEHGEKIEEIKKQSIEESKLNKTILEKSRLLREENQEMQKELNKGKKFKPKKKEKLTKVEQRRRLKKILEKDE